MLAAESAMEPRGAQLPYTSTSAWGAWVPAVNSLVGWLLWIYSYACLASLLPNRFHAVCVPLPVYVVCGMASPASCQHMLGITACGYVAGLGQGHWAAEGSSSAIWVRCGGPHRGDPGAPAGEA